MPYVVPTTFTAGSVLTAAQMNVIGGDLVDHELYVSPIRSAWTSFTPTMSGGFANGNASASGNYCQTGKIVHFYGYVLTGSTSTYGSILRLSLPVAARSGDAQPGINAFASVAGNTYQFTVLTGTTTSNIELACLNASGTYLYTAQTTATAPATWATGALIRYAGTYEAA